MSISNIPNVNRYKMPSLPEGMADTSILFTLSKAGLSLVCLWLFSLVLAQATLPWIMGVVLLCALAITGLQAYHIIMRKTCLSLTYIPGSFLNKVLGWRSGLIIVVFVVSLAGSYFMLLELALMSTFDWVFVFATAPVYVLIYHLSARLLSRASVDWLVPARSAFWATLVTPVVMVLIYGLSLKFFGSIVVYDSLKAARGAGVPFLTDSSSHFIRESGQWVAMLAVYRDYALGRLALISDPASLLICVRGYGAVFLTICSFMAFFIQPFKEYRRIFLPLTPSSSLPKVSPLDIGFYAAILAMFMIMGYLPGVAWLEEPSRRPGSSGSPSIASETRLAVQEKADAVIRAVSIGGSYYSPKLEAERDALLKAALMTNETARENLINEVNRIFDIYENNVDSYLDWYYSLSGEYGRLANMVLGEIESYMAEKMRGTLGVGSGTAEVNRIIRQSEINHTTFKADLAALMEQHKMSGDVIEGPGKRLEVVKTMTEYEFYNPTWTDPDELMSFQTRLGGSAALGVSAGITTTVITGKVAQKATFSIAAKALVRAGGL